MTLLARASRFRLLGGTVLLAFLPCHSRRRVLDRCRFDETSIHADRRSLAVATWHPFLCDGSPPPSHFVFSSADVASLTVGAIPEFPSLQRTTPDESQTLPHSDLHPAPLSRFATSPSTHGGAFILSAQCASQSRRCPKPEAPIVARYPPSRSHRCDRRREGQAASNRRLPPSLRRTAARPWLVAATRPGIAVRNGNAGIDPQPSLAPPTATPDWALALRDIPCSNP